MKNKVLSHRATTSWLCVETFCKFVLAWKTKTNMSITTKYSLTELKKKKKKSNWTSLKAKDPQNSGGFGEMAAKGDSPFLSVHPWGPLKHCLATLRLTLSYPLISQTLRKGPDNDTLFNCEKRGQGSTKETRQPTTNSLCFQRENQSHISVYEKPWHNRKSNCVPEIRECFQYVCVIDVREKYENECRNQTVCNSCT